MANRTSPRLAAALLLCIARPWATATGVTAPADAGLRTCASGGDAGACAAERPRAEEGDSEHTSFLAEYHAVKARRRSEVAEASLLGYWPLKHLDQRKVREESFVELARHMEACLQKPMSDPASAVPSEAVFAAPGAHPVEKKTLWALHNRRITGEMRPLAVVFARSPSEVVHAMKCGVELKVPVHGQSGRHSYVPYCRQACLLVNTYHMKDTIVDPVSETAVLGAGLNLGQAYTNLSDVGFTIAGGTCPTVGLAGLALGGGQGILNRLHGLLIDKLYAVDAVLSNGTIVHANATQYSDLLFLAKGGGGNTFPGVAIAFHFNLIRKPQFVTEYFAKWQVECEPGECAEARLGQQAIEVIRVWQDEFLTHPDHRVYAVVDIHPISEAPGQGPYITMSVKFIDIAREEAEQILHPGLYLLKEYPHVGTWSTHSYIQSLAIGGGIGTIGVDKGCRTWEEGLTNEEAREHMIRSEPPFCASSSAFDLDGKYRSLVVKKFSEHALDQISALLDEAPSFNLTYEGDWQFHIQLNPTNGQTAAADPASTAFPWRDEETLTLVVVSKWSDDCKIAQVSSSLQALNYMLIAHLQPYVGTSSYYNYADEDMPGGVVPLRAYFGENSLEVVRIRRKYVDLRIDYSSQWETNTERDGQIASMVMLDKQK